MDIQFFREDGAFDSALQLGDAPGVVAVDAAIAPARVPVHGAALLSTLMASTNDGVIVTDEDNKILMVNPAFTRVTGYSEEEAVGRTPAILRSGKHGPEFYQAVWESLLTTHHWKGEIWNRNKAGEIYVELLRIFRVADPGTGAVRHIGVFTDITEHHRQRSQALRRARYDSLTGLPNRTNFVERLTASVHEAKRSQDTIGLIILNIDNFRRVNEHFGHDMGDRVLIAVARGLRERLRSTDVIARLSGDEFAVLAPLQRRHQLTTLARLLQEVVTQAGLACGIETPITTSIGLATGPADGKTADELLRHAAAAVDEAQRLGVNKIASHSSLQSERTHQRFQIEAALRRAVKAKAFTLAFQPRVDIRTRRLVGAEALIRWTDPQIGPVPPAGFIPLAEEIGLIGEIGDWVLAEVARAAVRWREAGLPTLPFAANVSAIQLVDSHLTKVLQTLLTDNDLTGADIQIEVTETALASDAGTARRVLSDLRRMGITVALDDFGTGFATLASLRNLPADELKIDRSFISNIGPETEDAEIVRMVLALGQALKRTIVAEGVETEAQAELLAGLGCHFAQGWLYGRPMPLDDLMALRRSTL
ncbi:MAG: hypothetical protein RLY86_1225 [Pseudomonadota bacterium]